MFSIIFPELAICIAGTPACEGFAEEQEQFLVAALETELEGGLGAGTECTVAGGGPMAPVAPVAAPEDAPITTPTDAPVTVPTDAPVAPPSDPPTPSGVSSVGGVIAVAASLLVGGLL